VLLTGARGAWGGKETPRPLEVARFPDMNFPVCVVKSVSGKGEYSVSVMACVSNMACVEMDRRIQMGDGCGEPSVPCRVDLVTAPGSHDGSYGVRGALRARPARARLRDPARKCSMSDTSQPRGRLGYRRVSGEFGKQGFPRGRVYGASRAACRVLCSRNVRSGFPG